MAFACTVPTAPTVQQDDDSMAHDAMNGSDEPIAFVEIEARTPAASKAPALS